MDQNTARFINNAKSLAELAQIEENAQRKNALTPEIMEAISRRASDFGRLLIEEKTGLDLSILSPAEEKIVQAISQYISLKKLSGTNANRTLDQIRNRGLLDSAEISVAKSKPTIGYEELAKVGLSNISYEQIIIDHPDEFSSRALWFARRTLGQPNETEKPPAKLITPVQKRTEILLGWLQERSIAGGGNILPFSNAEAASILGMEDMQVYGRAFGNIQSRIDYACYSLGLPPLGLTADTQFSKAWNQGDRDWAFPMAEMKLAAQSRVWKRSDFEKILRKTEDLPGQAHISWQKDLAEKEGQIKVWAFGLKKYEDNEPELQEEEVRQRNPDWSYDELILALDLYIRYNSKPPQEEIAELSVLLRSMAIAHGLRISPTYRNKNGVGMKISNFMRLDPQYTSEGKVGLAQGSISEEKVWNEFYHDPKKLAEAAKNIRFVNQGFSDFDQEEFDQEETPYWVFVCNPKKWAIDKFLESGVRRDSWGVRASDIDKFSSGQLAIIRVGNDTRTLDELGGRPKLEAGIYAVCEVESEPYDGTGATDEYWTPGEQHEPGKPTVKIRYLKSYESNPLTIERLKQVAPNLSPLLLNGHQASSFPISAKDFHQVISLLGDNLEDILDAEEAAINSDTLAEMDKKYKGASPEVKERLSRTIERGPIGKEVKRANDYKCQLCQALGFEPLGFKKSNGEHYVEAHHVIAVSKREAGSLSASNIMTLCANHHRQVHYGDVNITILESTFEVNIGERSVSIKRYKS